MRIREIIIESLKLPVKKYKLYLAVFFLFIVLESVNDVLYSYNLGDLYLLFILISFFTILIIFGIILSLTNAAVLEENPEFNFKEHLIEAIKEYLVTMYYILLSFLLSSLFSIRLGFFSIIFKIQYYVSKLDINNSILGLNELLHQLPISMQASLYHSIQLNMLVGIFILIIFSSWGFIGKIVSIKSDNFRDAFDLRIVFSIIRQIGFFRYLKFILSIVIVSVFLCNLSVYMDLFGDVVFSAFLESVTLFVIINAFYLIIEDSYNNL